MRRQSGGRSPAGGGVRRFRLLALMLTALLLLCLFKLEQQIRPVALTMAQYACKGRAVRWMELTVAQKQQEEPELLEELYILERDEAGRVVSVTANAANLTRLQYALETALTEGLEAGELDFDIPLGTLTGLQIFSGRGPGVNVKVIHLSHIDSRLDSTFSEAGVNQTQLQTDLVLTVELCCVLAGMQVETEAQCQVRAAQIVIVGETPQFYVQGAGSVV